MSGLQTGPVLSESQDGAVHVVRHGEVVAADGDVDALTGKVDIATCTAEHADWS